MSATKKSKASKPKRRAVHKTGLVALAAAAMASSVASAPALAQSQTQVSPQPGPTTEDLIDQRMGTIPPDAATAVTPTEGAIPKRDQLQTGVLQPTLRRDQPQTGVLQPAPIRDQLQTIILKPKPVAPSTKDKALIFTGPSKPTR